jgi:hypothetical protein
MRRLLVITYYWPPAGGAGVQRWLKFSKYLPLYGWEPVILTVDPQYAVYPALDNTLSKDIPDHIEVIRTKATDWFRLYGSDKSKVPSHVSSEEIFSFLTQGEDGINMLSKKPVKLLKPKR